MVALVVTAILVFFSFTVVGNLIASPFNDLLSERTEAILGPPGEKKRFSFRSFLRETWRTLIEESKKMAFFVFGMVLIFLLNLIPAVGPFIYAVLSFLFTLFFLAVEYTGFVFSRRNLSFREQRRFIFSRKRLMFGFSFGVLALLAIPLLQFLCIPVAVVGATQLWLDERGEGTAGLGVGSGKAA
jgi:CysZ protein